MVVLVAKGFGFAVERDSETPPAEFEKSLSFVYGLRRERSPFSMEWLCSLQVQKDLRSCLQYEERRPIEVGFVSLKRVFVPTSSRCEAVVLVRERNGFAAQGGSKTPPAEAEKQ